MSDEQIKHMVNRFLQWKLPENFNPDGGISFKKTFNENAPWGPMKNEPVGTNLFDAVQTEAMVRYMVDGLPAGGTFMKEVIEVLQMSATKLLVVAGETGNQSLVAIAKNLQDAAGTLLELVHEGPK